MKLVIGLGNPGKKYENTRHNVGWLILDKIAGKKTGWQESKKSNCFYLKEKINHQEIELIKPLTFMNNSGQTVAHIQKKHNIKNENIIVIHDDLDLPLGTIRLKLDGSSGGHNGLQSIIDHLKTDKFIRLKIGIANDQRNIIPAEKFVLQKFNQEEKKALEKIIIKSVDILNEIINKKEVKEKTFYL